MSSARHARREGGRSSGRRRGGNNHASPAAAAPSTSIVIDTLQSSVLSGADVAALLYEARASAETVEKELSVTHRSPAKELRNHLAFVNDQIEKTKARHAMVVRAEQAHLAEWEARNERLVVQIEAQLEEARETLDRTRAMLAEAEAELTRRIDISESMRIGHQAEIAAALRAERALGQLVAKPPSSNVVTLVHVDVPHADRLAELRPRAWAQSRGILFSVLRDRLAVEQGYEVRRGVDSYLAAFRSPGEAVRFCFAAQEQLLDAAWPLPVLHTSMTEQVKESRAKSTGASADAQGSSSTARRRKERTYVLFRGPRVRMACVSGLPEVAHAEYGERTLYKGTLHTRLVAVANAARPGQIIVDEAAAMVVHEHEEEWGYPSSIDLGEFDTGGGRGEALFSVLPESLSGRERGFAPIGEENGDVWDGNRASRAHKSSSSLMFRSRANLLSAGASKASLGATSSRGNLHSRGDLRQLVSLEPPAEIARRGSSAQRHRREKRKEKGSDEKGDGEKESAEGNGTPALGEVTGAPMTVSFAVLPADGEGSASGDSGYTTDGSDDSEIDPENGDGDAGTRFMPVPLVDHDAQYLETLDGSVEEAQALVDKLRGAVKANTRIYRRLNHMVLEFRTNPAGLLRFMNGQVQTLEERVVGLEGARDDAKRSVENIAAHMSAIRTRWFDEICPTANRIPGLQREIIALIRAKRKAREGIIDERNTYLEEISGILRGMALCAGATESVDKSLDNMWLWVEFRLLKELGYLI